MHVGLWVNYIFLSSLFDNTLLKYLKSIYMLAPQSILNRCWSPQLSTQVLQMKKYFWAPVANSKRSWLPWETSIKITYKSRGNCLWKWFCMIPKKHSLCDSGRMPQIWALCSCDIEAWLAQQWDNAWLRPIEIWLAGLQRGCLFLASIFSLQPYVAKRFFMCCFSLL